MRVLLQDVVTRRYVGARGSWTPEAERARHFAEVVQALDYALSRGLGDVCPIIKCDDARLDVMLPSLPPLPCVGV